MKRAAVYRVLYGEDFIRRSIESVIDAVDEVYVFWTNKVWGDCTEVKYKGEIIQFPDKFDSAVDEVKSIGSPKIKLVEYYQPSPRNQFTNLINNFVDADVVAIVEHDQIFNDAKAAFKDFEASGRKVAAMQQVEHWKTEEYRIPQRRRAGPVFWRPPLPSTSPGGLPVKWEHWLNGTVKNLGFCVSDKTMYWKHLAAIAFSAKIMDSPPREDWYDEVWLKWHPEMKNLEIAEGCSSAIKHAYKS